MFKRILIANRGEIALRILRACRELEIEPVVVYSQADAEALHVQLAEESYCIGPARAADSYLNMNAILTVAKAAGCDAIHPGYGFLSENDAFADACAEAGIAFIGAFRGRDPRHGQQGRGPQADAVCRGAGGARLGRRRGYGPAGQGDRRPHRPTRC